MKAGRWPPLCCRTFWRQTKSIKKLTFFFPSACGDLIIPLEVSVEIRIHFWHKSGCKICSSIGFDVSTFSNLLGLTTIVPVTALTKSSIPVSSYGIAKHSSQECQSMSLLLGKSQNSEKKSFQFMLQTKFVGKWEFPLSTFLNASPRFLRTVQ